MTLYTGLSLPNESWKSQKTVYDPCPAGGDAGVWAKALGSPSNFTDGSLYDSVNKGMNFSGRLGSASTIWYSASGYRLSDSGGLHDVGYSGYCWSCSQFDNYSNACLMDFGNDGNVFPLLLSKQRRYRLWLFLVPTVFNTIHRAVFLHITKTIAINNQL